MENTVNIPDAPSTTVTERPLPTLVAFANARGTQFAEYLDTQVCTINGESFVSVVPILNTSDNTGTHRLRAKLSPELHDQLVANGFRPVGAFGAYFAKDNDAARQLAREITDHYEKPEEKPKAGSKASLRAHIDAQSEKLADITAVLAALASAQGITLPSQVK